MADCPPHHWRIETPHGPVSRGVCRLCGATREYCNTPANEVSAKERQRLYREQNAVIYAEARE